LESEYTSRTSDLGRVLDRALSEALSDGRRIG
jgi:hypothetical protein